MFCPKCSQQQASDGVRFCSRCGFQLEIVKELLATDGTAPLTWPVAETHTQERSARDRGIRQGIMLMLLTAFIVPLVAILSKLGLLPREFVALAAIFCAIGGFIRFIYALMMEEGAKRGKPSMPPAYNPASSMQSHLQSGATPAALPPRQSIPASEFGRRRTETAEMVQPPSVTENTTRLLDNANEK